MIMRRILAAFVLLNLLGGLPHASAHYLWVTVDSQGGEFGTANIYFEEGPAAGDGEYLDHFTKTSKTWIRTVEEIEPKTVATAEVRKDGKRWLRAELPAAAPRSVDCYGKFGVYAYGDTKVLLHYYARNLDLDAHGDLHELGRAEQMRLEMVPHDMGEEVALTVLWKGKPAADRTVNLRGPNRFRKNLKTDRKGRVRFVPAKRGRYTFRTSVEEATPGREGDEAYELIRHNGTLVMTLPLRK